MNRAVIKTRLRIKILTVNFVTEDRAQRAKKKIEFQWQPEMHCFATVGHLLTASSGERKKGERGKRGL